MQVFADAMADIFADTDMTVPADYRRGGQGPASRIRVVRSVREPGMQALGLELRARADMISVRVADAPHLAPGDSFTFDPDTAPTIVKVIEAPELDGQGLSYTAVIRRY